MDKKKTLVATLRKESEATQRLEIRDSIDTPPIAVIEVEPDEQPHVSLGVFKADKPPKGFALEVIPGGMKNDIEAQLTRLSGEYDEYELVLHVANYGDRTVNVEVSEL